MGRKDLKGSPGAPKDGKGPISVEAYGKAGYDRPSAVPQPAFQRPGTRKAPYLGSGRTSGGIGCFCGRCSSSHC